MYVPTECHKIALRSGCILVGSGRSNALVRGYPELIVVWEQDKNTRIVVPVSVGRSVLVWLQYYADTSKGRITDYTAKKCLVPSYGHELS